MWCPRANGNSTIPCAVMTKSFISMTIFCGGEQALRSWVFTRVEASQSDICSGPWMQQISRGLYPQSATGWRSDDSVGPSSTHQQHQPTATWYRRRAVQTSLQTRRSQPPCLSVCRAELQTVNAKRCRLPRGRSVNPFLQSSRLPTRE